MTDKSFAQVFDVPFRKYTNTDAADACRYYECKFDSVWPDLHYYCTVKNPSGLNLHYSYLDDDGYKEGVLEGTQTVTLYKELETLLNGWGVFMPEPRLLYCINLDVYYDSAEEYTRVLLKLKEDFPYNASISTKVEYE